MATKKYVWLIGLFLIVLTGCSAFGSSKDDAKAKIDASASKESDVIVCGVGTALNQQTNQCVVVNNGGSGSSSSDSAASLAPSPLTPPPATTEQCREPSGVFTGLHYRQRNFISGFLCSDACKADVLGMFRYQGNCPADIYIEAGIPNAPQSSAPLSIAPSGYFSAQKGSASACDGNTHFNGIQVKQMQPNQIVIFELQPEHYGVEGTYPLNVGAYTGCLKDGGIGFQVLTQSLLVGFSNNYQRNTGNNLDIDNSWVQII